MADFSDYAALIRRFTDGEMVVEDFERTYLAKFKADARAIEEPVYGILNSLFSYLDCYTTDEDLIAADPISISASIRCAGTHWQRSPRWKDQAPTEFRVAAWLFFAAIKIGLARITLA